MTPEQRARKRLASKLWRARNKKSIAAYNAKWNKEHPNYWKEYYAKNRLTMLDRSYWFIRCNPNYHKEYYAKNKDVILRKAKEKREKLRRANEQ